ncbi:solute carrier family 2, facilitated glucose transporter member 3-like [Mytilus trossulus]|uniref:solute carrier family 2, facilitated glucose transporter member 3-like n=1 Tax=Mytilus trossulus TaxID=6551 RepID=UPI003003C0D1
MVMMVLEAKQHIFTLVVFWTCLLNQCGASVHISVLTPDVDIGSPVTFKCTETRSSHKSYFKWFVDKNYEWMDNSTDVSLWTLQNTTDLNKEVKCTYANEIDIINSTSYNDIFLYLPTKKEIIGNYTQDNSFITFELHFQKVYPEPTCNLFSKKMKQTASSLNGSYYNVLLREKWLRRFYRCDNSLKLKCHIKNREITSDLLPKVPCPESKQSFWGVAVLVVIVLGIFLAWSINQNCTNQLEQESLQNQLEQESSATKTQQFSIAVALFGNAFSYGYNMAVLNNPAVVIIAFYQGISSELETRMYIESNKSANFLFSIFTAVYVFAGIIGVLLAERIAVKFGRRKPMMVNSIVMLLASGVGGIMFYSDSIAVLLFHRILSGLYCGIGLILSGMYAMEISKFTINSVKGSYGTYDRWFQLSITVGICCSSFLGIDKLLGNKELWPLLLVLNAVPALSNWFLCLCPESPVYLYLQTSDPLRTSKEALQRLCEREDVDSELSDLKKEATKQKKLKFLSLTELVQEPKLKVCLFLVCFLQIAQQLSGINTVIAYSGFIYQSSGVEIDLIEWMVFGTTLINVIMTTFSLDLMQENGRRSVLLLSTISMAVAFFVLFVSSNLCQNYNTICPYIAIVSVFTYIVFFSIGLGPIPYIIVQELFGQEAQGAAFNASVALNWIFNSIVMLVFRVLQMSMESYVYFMFSAITFVLCGIMYMILPETKDFAVTDIENSKEYKWVLKLLCQNVDKTTVTDNQSQRSASEDDPLVENSL